MTARSPTGTEWRLPVVEPVGPESVAGSATFAANTTKPLAARRLGKLSSRMPGRSPPKRVTATTPAPSHIPQAIACPVSAASLSKMKMVKCRQAAIFRPCRGRLGA
jgi:hypothetical protein